MVDSEENLIEDVFEDVRHNVALLVSIEGEYGIVKQPVKQRHHSPIEQDNTPHKDQSIQYKALGSSSSNLL